MLSANILIGKTRRRSKKLPANYFLPNSLQSERRRTVFSILSAFFQVNILSLPQIDIPILSLLPQPDILPLSQVDIPTLSPLPQPDISNNKVEMQYCTRCKAERPRDQFDSENIYSTCLFCRNNSHRERDPFTSIRQDTVSIQNPTSIRNSIFI